MAFPNASKEAAILAVKSGATHASIHTAAAGTTGASEATGGSPAYARKAITWTDGASDGSTAGSQVTFDVPSGSYVEIGFWTALTGGTFLGSIPLSSIAVLGSQGQVQVTPTLTAS
ncbi:phage tail fiber protein [Microbacterium sp. CJ88]|uniref:phage tail fiber protein n=1 Tax=Microbacterium sp. CJ88 TaxID=3445672 RepID=UPI003F655F97